MLFLIFILFGHAFCSETSILKCDFETSCTDFILDYNWGLTNGDHPHPLDHDHTLNTSAGHYLYYIPKQIPPFDQIKAEIKTKDWLQLPTNRGVCFRMWYYTSDFSLSFTIQIAQGDDEKLIRIIDTIHGKDPTTNDWALINLPLPAEKIKLYIRLNTSTVPLAFDDLSIDYCNDSHPLPPKTLYKCDFESSCTDDFVSLLNYPYYWSIMKAEDAIKIESQAPSIDFTFGNQSGHYALVPNSKILQKGNVGYLALEKSFNITSNESFCLNFQFYTYGYYYSGHLYVFALLSNTSKIIQTLWPPIYSSYPYTRDKWTWGIVNLPIGYYSLLFQVDTTDIGAISFALDDISITSCDYSPSSFIGDGAYLSLSCNFDDLTMCIMQNNDDQRFETTYNFTVHTGHTVPNKILGPTRDHTNNSESGGFIYLNQQLPYISGARGIVYSIKPMQSNVGMCIQFAYYVKSSIDNQNGTSLSILTGGCVGTQLWSISLDDSHGWQVVTIPAREYTCMITYYFWAIQRPLVPVSIAFDDIRIDQCNSLPPTTTTMISTSTTTTTTTTTTTMISTSTSTITTTDTEIITTSSSTSTIESTTTILSTSTTTPNSTQRLLSFSRYFMVIIYFLLRNI